MLVSVSLPSQAHLPVTGTSAIKWPDPGDESANSSAKREGYDRTEPPHDVPS